jgi:NAD(P)-dependent dehydrogenase (short-subunit alcohol dehydrogenase family)
MAQLKDKVAFVTGGSRGIGAAIAKALAAEGADVVLTYVGSEEKAHAVAREITAAGGKALALQVDSADPRAIQRAIERVVSDRGRLDILVNNAGIALATPTDALSVEEIDRVLAINTRAPFVATQLAARHMRQGGRVISIGSNLAERVLFPDLTLYSMSKSALVSMTRGFARELGPRGITVNLVNPGSTDTDMNPADGPSADAQRSFTALGRYATPHDIANAVVFLAGEGASSITGASLLVDGGSNA